ncbi:FadR/GntR family transcriptional regulator [Mangrovibacillus sp. Mu-81]|uniref:FadR/GntR family transcriptional regulator n=1 Tax=Mangrovibacillus sp. Mu-81 TaxID=3121478 RepID=UPI002FE486FD
MKVKRKSLVDHIVHDFMKDVKEGKYTYGEKLPSQKEMSNYYQVSLIALREALTKLSAIGIISFRQGKGTYLNKVEGRSDISSEFSSLIFHDINNLRSIVEARQIIERETSFLAAKRKTPEDVSELKRTIDGMKVSFDDIETFGQWDLEFHIAIARASNNPVLQKIIMLLIDSYRKEVSKFFRIPGVIEKVFIEHEMIYHHIIDGNGADASGGMYSHLELPEKVFSAKLAEGDSM